jgi:predicted transcriptional regulator
LKEEVSVTEIWEVLSARRPLARNTVQTMITRLEENCWIRHRTLGKTYLYSAAVKVAVVRLPVPVELSAPCSEILVTASATV